MATIETRRLGPQYFEATVMQPGRGENAAGVSNLYPLHGDEWRVEAQVLRWKPWANVLGLDTQYRLDRLSGGLARSGDLETAGDYMVRFAAAGFRAVVGMSPR